MNQENKENQDNEPIYQGNHIPVVLKIAWVIFVIWMISYIAINTIPDLKNWLN